MTLEEAIKQNTLEEKSLRCMDLDTSADAIHIGIEAIKLIINLRAGYDFSPNSLLPGETEK